MQRGDMDFIQQHWALISANPWFFASWSVLVVMLTWGCIHFLYRHRLEQDALDIQRLRDRLSDVEKDLRENTDRSPAVTLAPVVGSFVYPDSGDHGTSILGHSPMDLVAGRTYSMAAVVPTGGRLKVQLIGTKPRYLSEMAAGWGFSVSTRNWQSSHYDAEDHTQWFTARSGEADLAFIPGRPGRISVRVVEGESQHVSWEKTLKVVD